MNINIVQNKEKNLRRLAAQRQLYSDAKKSFYFQVFFSGIVVVCLTIMSYVLSADFYVYIIFAVILIEVLDKIVNKKLKEKIEVAASIQEEFDCIVLDIPFNKIKFNKRDLSDVVYTYSKKYLDKKGNFHALTNWYTGVKEGDSPYSKIVCIKTNCRWSKELRENYSRLIKTLVAVVLCLLIFIALIVGLTVESFLVSILLPFLPLATLAYNIVNENSATIDTLKNMQMKLEGILEKIKYNANYPLDKFNEDVRILQDSIFEHRKNITIIPDFIYRLSREEYEETTTFTNAELNKLIKDLQNK